jgi:hypothetical protein
MPLGQAAFGGASLVFGGAAGAGALTAADAEPDVAAAAEVAGRALGAALEALAATGLAGAELASAAEVAGAAPAPPPAAANAEHAPKVPPNKSPNWTRLPANQRLDSVREFPSLRMARVVPRSLRPVHEPPSAQSHGEIPALMPNRARHAHDGDQPRSFKTKSASERVVANRNLG